jgi:hypothetical protein
VKLFTFGLFFRVLSVIALLFLALFASRRGLQRHSIKMKDDLDGFLKTRTLPDQQRCEKLIDGIEGCKAIADKALSSPVQVEALRQALGEISDLLSQMVSG